jgi:uncharacterized membrane protein
MNTAFASLLVYTATVGSIIALDMLWLAVLARDFYAREMLAIRGTTTMLPTPLWIVPGLIVWAVMAAAVIYFVVIPTRSLPIVHAVRDGALLGAAIYAVYDLTNFMFIPNWSLTLTLVDISWGTFLLAITAGISHFVAQYPA